MNKPTIAGKELSVAGNVKKSMKISSQYQPDKLLELINQGKTAQEICKELNIKHLQVLKAHVMRLMNSRKIFIEVPVLFLKSTKQAWVNKNGEVKICMKAVDFSKMELVPNLTEFSVIVNADEIILKKIVSGDRRSTESPSVDDVKNDG